MRKKQQAGKTRVAVVGGGIAGLTTAWALLERGFEVALYDERIHLGGKLGAHPARMPLLAKDWRDQKTGKTEDAAQYLDLKEMVFISDAAAEKFADELTAKRVPRFILTAVCGHYRRVLERLNVAASEDFPVLLDRFFDEAAGSLQVTPLRLPGQPTRPDQPIRAWEIAYDAVIDAHWRSTITFRVAIHQGDLGRLALELTDAVFHEHCYHMYLNWYHNFWALMEAIGLERSTKFRPLDEFVHVFPGAAPLARRKHVLQTIGDFSHGAKNLMSGAAPVPDMFLWFYSMLDLVAQQFDPGRYLDKRSVHAFLGSRWYATDESARFHEHLLAKAFAVPAYSSSADSYRRYVDYTMAAPDPMLWVLKGDSYTSLFKPFEDHLVEMGLRVKRGLQVCSITTRDGKLRMRVRPSDIHSPTYDPRTGQRSADDIEGPAVSAAAAANTPWFAAFDPEYIVLAVPPRALAGITGELRDAVPGLASVRKLQSAVTAALDLHFVRRLEGMPSSHMVLRDSALGLTVVDNAQIWNDGDSNVPTHLSVAVTDFYKIDGMHKDEATAAIVADLRRYFEFADNDIDYTRTYLQLNHEEPLFINEVGSEPWRPATRTDIPHLFLAGDFCENDIGVVSVEGAVVSGLLAARAIQAQVRADDPAISALDKRLEEIPILLPRTEPIVNAEALKALLLPHAAMAYADSKRLEWSRHPQRAVTPRDLQFHLEQALRGAGAIPAAGAGLVAQAARWLADQHARGRS